VPTKHLSQSNVLIKPLTNATSTLNSSVVASSQPTQPT
jgi:hypothetical protein